MREAARCMAEAQSARAAGLAREEALAGEIRALRRQLAGGLREDDPARALQVLLLGGGRGGGGGLLLAVAACTWRWHANSAGALVDGA